MIIVGITLAIFIRNLIAWFEFQPQPSSYSEITSKDNWDGSSKFTILFIGTDMVDAEHVFIDHLSIYSLDPRENKLSIFILNPDIKVTQTTLGYTLHYRTLLNNRSIDEDKITLLLSSIENLLAIKIDRYLMAEKNSFPTFSQFLNPLKVNVPKEINDEDTIRFPAHEVLSWDKGLQQVLPINFVEFAASDENGRDDQFQRQQLLLESITYNLMGFRSILYFPELIKSFEHNIFTDLGKWELFKLSAKLTSLKNGDIKKGYLRGAAYEKVIDLGFYDAVTPDINLIDKDINNIFFDLKVFKEQARIEVLNGSGVRGLAFNRARWVRNIGARVIQVGNSYETVEKTSIYCQEPEKYQITIAELQRFLGDEVEVITKDYPNRHVGDIVVVLGVN